MKILLLATEIGWNGGVQQYGRSIKEALVEEGHEVFSVETIASTGSSTKLLKLSSAVFTARRSGIDIVWVLHPRLAPVAVPLVRMLRIPAIVSTYGFETWGDYPLHWRQALRWARVVTGISNFSICMMGSPGHEAVLLPPTWGVDQDRDRPLPHQAARTTVAFVGRFDDPYKGLDTFVELARRFQGSGWSFEAAGAGSIPNFAANDNGVTVRLTSNASDLEVTDLYRRSAVVVVPSRVTRSRSNKFTGGEGFGIVLLEAARAGAVTLAADEGACPETVALLGNGIVCRPTADANETMLRCLLEDIPWRQALASAGIRASTRFSPDRLRHRVADVIAAAHCAD